MEFLDLLFATGFFLGIYASFAIGYYLDEWISFICSLRMRTTDTHLVIERASYEELEERVGQEILDSVRSIFITPDEMRNMNWGIEKAHDKEIAIVLETLHNQMKSFKNYRVERI